jgi:hypothetical protein
MVISFLLAAAHRLLLVCEIAGYKEALIGNEFKISLLQGIAILQYRSYYQEMFWA